MPTPGKYVLLKEGPVHLVAAMTISPESVWKTLNLQYSPAVSRAGLYCTIQLDYTILDYTVLTAGLYYFVP